MLHAPATRDPCGHRTSRPQLSVSLPMAVPVSGRPSRVRPSARQQLQVSDDGRTSSSLVHAVAGCVCTHQYESAIAAVDAILPALKRSGIILTTHGTSVTQSRRKKHAWIPCDA